MDRGVGYRPLTIRLPPRPPPLVHPVDDRDPVLVGLLLPRRRLGHHLVHQPYPAGVLRRAGVVQRVDPVVLPTHPLPLGHHPFARQKLLGLGLRRQVLGQRQVLVRLSKPFQVPLPDGLFGIRPAIRVEKSDMILKFARVDFQQPDEAVMLPASIETVHVLRGVPSLRIRQTLANYRRFLTKSEILPSGF